MNLLQNTRQLINVPTQSSAEHWPHPSFLQRIPAEPIILTENTCKTHHPYREHLLNSSASQRTPAELIILTDNTCRTHQPHREHLPNSSSLQRTPAELIILTENTCRTHHPPRLLDQLVYSPRTCCFSCHSLKRHVSYLSSFHTRYVLLVSFFQSRCSSCQPSAQELLLMIIFNVTDCVLVSLLDRYSGVNLHIRCNSCYSSTHPMLRLLFLCT